MAFGPNSPLTDKMTSMGQIFGPGGSRYELRTFCFGIAPTSRRKPTRKLHSGVATVAMPIGSPLVRVQEKTKSKRWESSARQGVWPCHEHGGTAGTKAGALELAAGADGAAEAQDMPRAAAAGAVGVRAGGAA